MKAMPVSLHCHAAKKSQLQANIASSKAVLSLTSSTTTLILTTLKSFSALNQSQNRIFFHRSRQGELIQYLFHPIYSESTSHPLFPGCSHSHSSHSSITISISEVFNTLSFLNSPKAMGIDYIGLKYAKIVVLLCVLHFTTYSLSLCLLVIFLMNGIHILLHQSLRLVTDLQSKTIYQFHYCVPALRS